MNDESITVASTTDSTDDTGKITSNRLWVKPVLTLLHSDGTNGKSVWDSEGSPPWGGTPGRTWGPS
jgi:hypothetical protein